MGSRPDPIAHVRAAMPDSPTPSPAGCRQRQEEGRQQQEEEEAQRRPAECWGLPAEMRAGGAGGASCEGAGAARRTAFLPLGLEFMMECKTRAMTIKDYEAVVELWRRTDGIVLSDTDEKEPMRRFLSRNPGLSLVAKINDEVIGAILCSHDGRRGYLHHLAVDKRHRHQGLGSELVQQCLTLLECEGIVKCNIFILEQNESGIAFWNYNGFKLLPHFGWMQRTIGYWNELSYRDSDKKA